MLVRVGVSSVHKSNQEGTVAFERYAQLLLSASISHLVDRLFDSMI